MLAGVLRRSPRDRGVRGSRVQRSTAAPAETCARCRERPASRGSPHCATCEEELGTLWHEDEIRQEMLALTYDELAKDRRVRADLDALLERIRPLVKDHVFVPASAPAAVRDEIAGFVGRWYLPKTLGAVDVWMSVSDAGRARLPGDDDAAGVRLRPVRRGTSFTNERRRSYPMNRFLIRPHGPEPFVFDPVFDPTTISRRQMERRAERAAMELKGDILRQVDEVIDAWRNTYPKWRPVPPRYRKPGEMERIARRIAFAMVGLSAGKIAREEQPATTASAVRKALQEWLPRLEVEVRQMRAPLGASQKTQ
jgi:hypothetical protein